MDVRLLVCLQNAHTVAHVWEKVVVKNWTWQMWNGLENGTWKQTEWKSSLHHCNISKNHSSTKTAVFIVCSHAFEGLFTLILCPALITSVHGCANLINHTDKTDYTSRAVSFPMQWLKIIDLDWNGLVMWLSLPLRAGVYWQICT